MVTLRKKELPAVLIHSCLTPCLAPVARQNILVGCMWQRKVIHFTGARKQKKRRGQGSHSPSKGRLPVVASLPPSKPLPLKVTLTPSSTTGWGSSL